MLLMGRALTDGRVTARVKYDLTENLTVKANAQVCMLVSVLSNIAYDFLLFLLP